MTQKFSRNKIWFLGRSYAEYIKMFDLNDNFLKDQKILDCAAGASSFTPRLVKKGYDITAVDILYELSVDSIKERCENDFSTLMQVHSGMDHKVDWNFFKNKAEMIQHRVEAYKDFIDDYHVGKGKVYLKNKLPSLSFYENQFSLVLCSHFLFLYDDRLSYDFHLDSVLEMLRVTSGEVRIYPLVSLQSEGEKSAYVEMIIKDINGYADVEILKVDYKFRKGGNEMMKIRKFDNRSRINQTS